MKLPTMIIWTYFEALQGQQRNTFLLSGLSTQIHLLHAFSSFLDFQESMRPRIFICIYPKNLQCSKDWILFRSASLKFFILGQTLFFQQQQQNKKQEEKEKQMISSKYHIMLWFLPWNPIDFHLFLKLAASRSPRSTYPGNKVRRVKIKDI